MCRFSYLSDNILTSRLSETPHRTRPRDYSGGACNEPCAHTTWFQLQLYVTRQCGAGKERLETMQRAFVFMVQIPGLLLAVSSYTYYSHLFRLCGDPSLKLGVLCRNRRH